MAAPFPPPPATTCFLLLLAQVILLLGLLPPPTTADNEQVMLPGDVLATGNSLGVNRVARFLRFRMQDDCNLVLYDNGNPRWSSNTFGRGRGCRALFSGGGRLEIRDGRGMTIWIQNRMPWPLPNSPVLVLRQDASVAIYDRPIWSTRMRAEEVANLTTVAVGNAEEGALPAVDGHMMDLVAEEA